MGTTTFYNKDGSISSIRVTSGNMKNGVSLTHYMGSTRGGVTFHNNGVSSRFNNKGQSMGTSVKIGNHTTSYYNTFGGSRSSMKPF